jgi:hypothetical protein
VASLGATEVALATAAAALVVEEVTELEASAAAHLVVVSAEALVEASEGGGVGRPVWGVVLMLLAGSGLSVIGVVMFSGKESKCDPRTRICTSGA